MFKVFHNYRRLFKTIRIIFNCYNTIILQLWRRLGGNQWRLCMSQIVSCWWSLFTSYWWYSAPLLLSMNPCLKILLCPCFILLCRPVILFLSPIRGRVFPSPPRLWLYIPHYTYVLNKNSYSKVGSVRVVFERQLRDLSDII